MAGEPALPPPSTLPQKRPAPPALPAPFGPQDDLPNPRRLSFKRRLHCDIEDHFRDLLASAPVHGEATSTASQLGAKALGVKVVIGRLKGKDREDDIALPIATETLMDGNDHCFDPELSLELFASLQALLEEKMAIHKATPPQERRWADVSLEQRQYTACADSQKTVATFYCPESRWHYQLRLRGSHAVKEASPESRERKEINYVFRKCPGPGDPAWTVHLVRQGEKSWVELGLNEAFLLQQRDRMRAAKPHNFSRICRDFRRNAQALQQALDSIDNSSLDSCSRELFYPGIFDRAEEMQDFYAKRAVRNRAVCPESIVDRTERVRRFNNCIKTMLLERFIDEMPGEIRLLDIACGRGQDIQKYSTEHRKCQLQKVVGIDFVAEAIDEAKRRYSALVVKARQSGRQEYAAAFYARDCRDASTFALLEEEGHGEFDVVVSQFALHYLLRSEHTANTFLVRMKRLLRPGGRLIATVPSSEVLADFYEAAGFFPSVQGNEKQFRKSFFGVSFSGSVWSHLPRHEDGELDLDEVFLRRWGLPYTFTLQGAVDAEEYVLPWEAFEELIVAAGFRVVADAPFPYLFQELQGSSKFYNNFFIQDERNKELNDDEKELFRMYNGFVIEREASD